MGFKLIAIKPLDSLIDNLKIIKPDKYYYFYNNYTIDGSSITKVDSISDHLYSHNGLKIYLSAIVGKNGSGKSSLIELLIRAMNNLASQLQVNEDIQWIESLKLELYYETDSYYKIRFDESVTIYKQELNGRKFKKQPIKSFNLSQLFYSIIINYSHYSLNTSDVGSWVKSLFHKNDGYQTPIVLSPMRNDGNIDINSERSLSSARILINILWANSINRKTEFKIMDKLSLERIQLSIKSSEDHIVYELTKKEGSINELSKSGVSRERTSIMRVHFSELDIEHNYILRELNKKYPFGFSGNWESGNYIKNLAHEYLLRKLVKIAVTYPFYNKYFDRENKRFVPKLIPKFLNDLFNKNQNHISFKLKQTMNFLRYGHIEVKKERFDLDISEFYKKITAIIKERRLKFDSAIDFIPPPIFQTTVFLKRIDQKSRLIELDKLSSGEKQFIYSLNSIFYHLINLDSIRNSKLQVGHNNINLMLEEIELYFHPDMQKEFINEFLNRLGDFRFKRIKALNVCFITHSPFILSDIPNSNILFLDEDGNPKLDAITEKTFGANIHDLIKISFFLKDGAMGAFAKKKISDVINFLNYSMLKKDLELNTKSITPAKKREISEEIKELEKKITEYDRLKFKEIIEIIGEPILRIKLQEMYNEVFPADLQKAQLMKQMKDLQLQINALNP
jgi:hypothetical protein